MKRFFGILWTPFTALAVFVLCIFAVVYIYKDTNPSVNDLLQDLKSKSFAKRIKAIYLLGEQHERASNAVEELIRIMEEDADEYIRSAAAISLGKIGDQRALKPLQERIEKYSHKKESSHYKACVWALNKLQSKIRAREKAFRDKETTSRHPSHK